MNYVVDVLNPNTILFGSSNEGSTCSDSPRSSQDLIDLTKRLELMDLSQVKSYKKAAENGEEESKCTDTEPNRRNDLILLCKLLSKLIVSQNH